VDVLRDWQEAPALVLSCPGPMRRHSASLLPLEKAALPQVFLGGESQLLAYAASVPHMAGRLFFAPLPEMFGGPASLDAAWRAAGRTPPETGAVVHLRFGSVRDARILKGARNAAVVAEAQSAPPLTVSHHPFASGQMLPAATERLLVYGPHTRRPHPIGKGPLPESGLPGSAVTADLGVPAPRKPQRTGIEAGLDLVSLANYSAPDWAAGCVRSQAVDIMPAADAALGARPSVLLPWNLAHFGSIVPELLKRLATLRRPDAPIPVVVIMPFNYLGLTGTIRTLIADLREAAEAPDPLMNEMFLARVTRLPGLGVLKNLSRVVWIDGNDPEGWWTLARFGASGFDPIVIDPDESQPDPGRFPADEPIRVEADTRHGTLSFDVRVPSLRALPHLLAMTAQRPRRRGPRRA
jgi:hypothetical protein